MRYTLLEGDCLERMQEIPDASIDMVLTDPPYGTTSCKWDIIIPLAPMWEQLKRVIKSNGAIILSSSQPFTSILIMSNISWFKYEIILEKEKPSNVFQLRHAIGKTHENAILFSQGHISYNGKNKMTYNPQGVKDGGDTGKNYMNKNGIHGNRNTKKYKMHGSNYPRSVLRYTSDCVGNGKNRFHPTQKPVSLMEYFIKTYTNEGESVLDFAMGSGTTGVAAKKLNRSFVGIELDDNYFGIAEQRIKDVVIQPSLFEAMPV